MIGSEKLIVHSSARKIAKGIEFGFQHARTVWRTE